MIEVTHRPDGTRWEFTCDTIYAVQGGGKCLAASVDAAEHAVRHYLSDGGYPMLPAEAHLRTRHNCAGRATTSPLAVAAVADTDHTLELVLS